MTLIAQSSLPEVGTDLGAFRQTPAGFQIIAAARTDAFVPPDGGAPIDRLPGRRLNVGTGPWAVSAHVVPEFNSAFDAGALMLRTEGGSWAKLAFERAPDGRTMAVSVVTRDYSDDANGPLFSGPALNLRACFTGKAYAFHVSIDGRRWDLVRFFELPHPVEAVDFIAQSPTGEGCSVAFSDVRLVEKVPSDLRDGN